jgi:hypothetical protein
MECRIGCGACCIAPSINAPFYGMPEGKKAGERCLHLNVENLCDLFADPRRPECCGSFQAEKSVCGNSYDEAILVISSMELATLRDKKL